MERGRESLVNTNPFPSSLPLFVSSRSLSPSLSPSLVVQDERQRCKENGGGGKVVCGWVCMRAVGFYGFVCQ